MEQLGDRLRLAVDEAFKTHKKFIAAIGSGGLRGTSMQAVYDYFKNDREPSLEFIRAAADLLSVREAWLAFGQEPMRDSYDGDITKRVEDEVAELVADSAAVTGHFHAVLNRWVSGLVSAGQEVPPTEILGRAKELRDMVRNPWEELSHRGIGSSGADWYNYRIAMLHALMLALTDGYLRHQDRNRKRKEKR